MITKEMVKSQIDRLPENDLLVLYRVIEALNESHHTFEINPNKANWHTFVENTYGSLAADPIKRWPQGEYEIREDVI